MSRSRLSYPLNRGIDMEPGGAADLQTDVMRFMAIISLCLVAIFALVQSLPSPVSRPEPRSTRAVEEAVAAPVEAAAAAAPQRPAPPPAIEKPGQVPEAAAAPALASLPPAVPYEQAEETGPAALERSEQAAPLPPRTAPAALAPADVAPAAVGFTLRFESDLALTRLVARNEIGLYAIQPGKALRMTVNRGAVSFWPASNPGQIHEMDASTVPPDVITALRRSGTPGTVKWGVTLPPRLSRDLDRYLHEQTGGSLVIGANGDLRLER